MVEIFIPTKPVQANCGNCGFLGWKVFVEAANLTIKGIEVKAGKLVKLECGRCHNIYELEEGHLAGDKTDFRANKSLENKVVTQEQIDGNKDLTS